MIEHWSDANAARWLRVPGQADDKYRRGVLGVRTGSARYPGAAVLGASAAWRTGLGLLRYVPPVDDAAPQFGLPTPAAAVLAAHPETVFGEGSTGSSFSAWLIGSGTEPATRSFREDAALRRLLLGEVPVVVDAGALHLAVERGTAASADAPNIPHAGAPHASAPLGSAPLSRAPLSRAPLSRAPLILTPHRGEFRRIWPTDALGDLPWPTRRRASTVPAPEALADAASRLAVHLGATILLKGSLTIAATPGGRTIATGPATTWLATAGTGDVLAGILGALVAVNAESVQADPELLGEIGATAALLHDRAARIAADVLGSIDERRSNDSGGSSDTARSNSTAQSNYTAADGSGHPIIAADVIDAIPQAFTLMRS